MKEYLSTVKIYSKSDNNMTNKVKTFKLWVLNINSLLQLWSYLEKMMPDVKFLYMRRFNQDPLENFFGKVRSLNGNTFNPTPIQFYFTFRKLFSIQYSNTNTGNCSEDKDHILTNLNEFKQSYRFMTEKPIQETKTLLDDHDYHSLNLSEENAFRYICGYLIRKCLQKHSCDTCIKYANSYTELNANTVYCFHRAYNSTEENLFGDFFMPDDNFVQFIKTLDKLFFDNIYNFITQKFIVTKLLTIFSKVSFNHPCEQFPKQYLLTLYSRVRLFYIY